MAEAAQISLRSPALRACQSGDPYVDAQDLPFCRLLQPTDALFRQLERQGHCKLQLR
jgi:hypothetical protein